ncbi:bifunctional (p)ppGpp synthetase/guanosine-3',5'-bis(diphosphate) 3'-pyrophosphohydrolase [Candidatus Woesearchaeota archaeon]|nr:bifunctional (p)ppGpp synthetase/guanosine-3',5'-bis(diphosphate) 3'-pyrophosphohydrolase [Candidatus Woesearchaeota archaeon]
MKNENLASEMGKKEFLDNVLEHNPHADLMLISRAYDFAQAAHSGQKRMSGEDYFQHVLNVAYILSGMQIDSETIAAALLHDVLEDTKTTKEQLKRDFGQAVTTIVAGVTKKIALRTTPEDRAENIRKVLLATIKDIRVILVKLADRMHNMRTLKYLSQEQQREIAQETLEVYVPIAYKLGMYRIKSELEDLCLRFLEPGIYQELKERIAKKKEEREKEVKRVVASVKRLLDENSIPAAVLGRAKNFYGIYKKMLSKKIPFEEVRDLSAIRIITTTADNCYKALNLTHSRWTPILNRFDDYITNPKPNMYQSLHTEILFENKPVEVQIRTLEMHHIAEEGIAAHWRYKDTERDRQFDRKIAWLKQILEWRSTESAKDLVESLKIDMFKDEIYVLTPKGDPIHLPENATPIDFAYAVHTEIGNHCKAAKVNGSIVPLDHELNPGDVVEIVTSKDAKPSRQWLAVAKTGFAREKIRRALGISAEDTGKKGWEVLTPSEILEKIDAKEIKHSLLQTARCCYLKIDEKPVGYRAKDGHVIIHHSKCENVKTLPEGKLIKLSWKEEPKQRTSLMIELVDRVGIFADILNTLTAAMVKVESVNSKATRNKLYVNFEISGTGNVEELVKKLKAVKGVVGVKVA